MSIGTVLLVAIAWIAIVLASTLLILPQLCVRHDER
jgi:hypothetical protein